MRVDSFHLNIQTWQQFVSSHVNDSAFKSTFGSFSWEHTEGSLGSWFRSSLPGSCVWKVLFCFVFLVHVLNLQQAGPLSRGAPERPRWPLTVSWNLSSSSPGTPSESLLVTRPPRSLTCISACVYLWPVGSVGVWMLCNGWVCRRRRKRTFCGNFYLIHL